MLATPFRHPDDLAQGQDRYYDDWRGASFKLLAKVLAVEDLDDPG